MSNVVSEMVRKVLVKEGPSGRSRLAEASGRSERMIERYSRGDCLPSRHVAYRLALACGFSDEDALKLAGEISKRSA